MTENPKKKLNKKAPDKAISPEQACVNSAITQAAAMIEISECLNDIAAEISIMRELQFKLAEKSGDLTQEELSELMPEEAEDEDGEG